MRRFKEPAIQAAGWLALPAIAAAVWGIQRIGRRL